MRSNVWLWRAIFHSTLDLLKTLEICQSTDIAFVLAKQSDLFAAACEYLLLGSPVAFCDRY